MSHDPIRVLWAQQHDTVFYGMGVFIAGPTPTNGEMKQGWRRECIRKLREDTRLCAHMIIVAPEPESGEEKDLVVDSGRNTDDASVQAQTAWEWQYLSLCRVSAFWLPTYWDQNAAAPFPANIGPTSRFEYGYFFSRWEQDRASRDFVVGAPADAQGTKWARQLAISRNLPWHILSARDKDALVPESFVDDIAAKLLQRKWCDC
jgi:hypothetical protein